MLYPYTIFDGGKRDLTLFFDPVFGLNLKFSIPHRNLHFRSSPYVAHD